MTKKLSLQEKKNRRPASRACIFCHEKHLQCSNERPCKNCVKRKLGHKCHDTVRKRAKYLNNSKSSTNSSSTANSSPPGTPQGEAGSPRHPQYDIKFEATSSAPTRNVTYPEEPPRYPPNTVLNTTNDVLNKLLFDTNQDDSDAHTPPIQPHPRSQSRLKTSFSSNYLNQEYLMLGDIILQSKPSSPSPSNTSASEHNSAVSPVNFLNMDLKNEVFQSQKKPSHKINTRPFISLGYDQRPSDYQDSRAEQDGPPLDPEAPAVIEPVPPLPTLAPSKLSQSSTIPNEYVSPLISQYLYRNIQDIYSNNIMNFDYPQSYHLLTHFLKKRFLGNNLSPEEKQTKRQNLLIILKLIASYRPTFISAHKSLLKPLDLQFLEMSLQRSLIDYQKLCHLNSSPTIIWRRSGEIVSMTDDMLSLLGFDTGDILSKRTFIVELMHDDESIINYYKLFKSVAVGNLHLSIFTKCKLTKKRSGDEEEEYIDFCSVWTVKRDLFDLPMLIIGQFLPILPAGEGVRMY
ncbi:uncharacterized protein CANTADRAFT_91987 [Suhomyces tanzawaensis NRRL Y-17324]|uniref:Glucose starvation modulator protein 1 n=1 Tax=Suhomyces tanzawaensis NRRL Y-17324 TaxID=984487 RepID=A0A1E4SDK8_9ASCO|nr:uncharacterized protein CANTADRAFT_91987 [Suhomyces tanzawaensis NRRL Y-17324]ODV77558.1 hypothetical protein CANTADRAFT_91987 [Suhomyces tanzawaensis NRRL Y-17324]